METTEATLERLLTALEDLTRQEEHLFNKGLYRDSVLIQERALPVATKIAALLVGPGVTASLKKPLQLRIQDLLQRRRAHYKVVTDKTEETGRELRKIREAELRTQMVRPYGGKARNQRPVSAFAAEG
jgi:hypothetical protein